jgi:hypothetical protein
MVPPIEGTYTIGLPVRANDVTRSRRHAADRSVGVNFEVA